jgi:hypothetical protein
MDKGRHRLLGKMSGLRTGPKEEHSTHGQAEWTPQERRRTPPKPADTWGTWSRRENISGQKTIGLNAIKSHMSKGF